MNIDEQFSNSESLSDSSDKLDILFFDTFTSSPIHDDYLNEDVNKNEPNTGLVQFISAVVIHEVRIIPLSTLVTAEQRTVRLGATNPSTFEVNFYVNDLKGRDSTFLDIGSFTYKDNENFIFKPNISVITDGLYLRGHFESVTLAVLGEVADLSEYFNRESTSSRLSNDINDHDRRSDVYDIKEPDDTQDSVDSQKDSFSSRHGGGDENETISTATKIGRLVQDVHSLSPSPENSASILSPTAVQDYNLLSPKTHSTTIRESHRLRKSNKDRDYDKNRRSLSNSISPNNYSTLKSRINYPISTDKNFGSSKEIERDELNSSHYRNRYEYYYNQYRSKRSREVSPESSSRSRYQDYRSSKYNHRSRSRSKDSNEHYRSNNRHSSITSSRGEKRQRSVSLEKNHDNRSIHSRDSRDDNRSICSLRTRNSGGNYYSDNSRESSKHRNYHSSHLRRSRSITPNKKSRSSRYSRDNSIDKLSDHKKMRYTSNIVSPSSTSPISVHYNNNNNKNSSPVSFKSSKEIESISSPNWPHDEDSLAKDNAPYSPTNISPNSLISNESLDQFDCDLKNESLSKTPSSEPSSPLITNEENVSINKEENDQLTSNSIEFFEPLSPSDNDELLENGNDNFEQISTSSDVEMENLDETNKSTENEKAELEIISSDEEYADDLDAALAFDKVEYAKNYLDNNGDIFDDDEIDNAFDLKKNLFNPFMSNQLNALKFPFNSNRTTTFIDLKLFNTIMKFVNDYFVKIYIDNGFDNRKIHIQDTWVKNVEELAKYIMKLTCPIYYSFNEDDNIIQSEQDLELLLKMLIMITKDGLDYDLALAQKLVPFKLRHLKAGIKLLIALFSSFDIRTKLNEEKMIVRLLDEDLPFELLKLYNNSFITLSLRLLILNGLIVICDHVEGIEYLCAKIFDWSTLSNTTDKKLMAYPVILIEKLNYNTTCYQYLLSIILAGQNPRLVTVFEELLEKIHLFELFKLFSTIPRDDYEKYLCNENETSDLIAILSQMSASFVHISNRLHRPLRFLPTISQYEINTAVHTSVPLLLLSTSDFILDNVPNHNQFEYIHDRFHCKHISCSSSKIAYCSQKSFYRFFKHFNLFSSFIELLKLFQASTKISNNNANHGQRDYLCDKVLNLLDLITSHQQGLKFLLEDEQNVNYVNQIHSILMNFNTENGNDKFANKFVNFGVKFITRLYTFNLIDNILFNIYSYQRENLKNVTTLVTPSNNSIVIDSLLRLFMMINFEKAIFRDTLVTVITTEHNFDAIYSFIIPVTSQFEPGNSEFINEKLSNSASVSFIYATKIAIACVQYLPEKNLLHFYETYGKSLLKNIENVQTFVQKSIVKLHKSNIFQNHILKYSKLISWISPLKNDNFNSHDELIIRKFVSILMKHHDMFQGKFKNIDNYINRVFFIEPELVTAIKILVSLCDPKVNYDKNQEPDFQYKYKYALISCYCLNCLTYILTLLDGITETCERPSHQTFAFMFNDSYMNLFVKNYSKSNSGSTIINTNDSNVQTQFKPQSLQLLSNSILHQGSLIIEFIRPSIRLIKLFLDLLLSSVGHCFNDSLPIPILLKCYHMMTHYFRLSNSNIYPEIELNIKTFAKSIQDQIIDIILSIYTTVYVEHGESEEALRKSVWTKMLKHLFDFMLLSPKYFTTGLEILSRILPKPLPWIVNKSITDSDYTFIINYRKLWSAHLNCINEKIENMINCLVLSSCIQVQTLLRIVCYKICDLYSPTVLTVTKAITEFLVHRLGDVLEAKSIHHEQPNKNEQIKNDSKYYCNNCMRIIDFILDLFASSLSFRIGILNAFYCFANSDKESIIHKLFHKMFDYLNGKKFEQNLNLTGNTFLWEILKKCDAENDENILEKYLDNFDGNADSFKTFEFSDKLTSKFFVACSISLNEYFSNRSIYSTNSDAMEMEDINSLNKDDKTTFETSDQHTMENSEKIYGEQFSRLSLKFQMPSVWYSLMEKEKTKSETESIEMTNVDLNELYKKYLNSDTTLEQVLTQFYLPIVELPETPDKPVDDISKLANINPQSKRSVSRGRGRMYGHRGDLFRSRPPNTSRPPSMHVDDFVALEQRADPLVGLVNKNRPNHLLHGSVNTMSSHSSGNSSISYGGKHSEYMRKKNSATHYPLHCHLSSPYSNYSNSIKSNSAGNSSHFNK